MIKPKQWVEKIKPTLSDLDSLGREEGTEIGEVWCTLSYLHEIRKYLRPEFAEAVEKEITEVMKNIQDNWRWFCEEEITATPKSSNTKVNYTLMHVDFIDDDNCK